MAANSAQRNLTNMGEDRQKKKTRPRRKEQAALGGKSDRDDNESNVCGTQYLETCDCFCCAQQRTALPALHVHLNDDESVMYCKRHWWSLPLPTFIASHRASFKESIVTAGSHVYLTQSARADGSGSQCVQM
jgi:hypothetical protein